MSLPQPRAFHHVQWWHLHEPYDLTPYDVLVCNPSLNEDTARAAAPEAVWFGSFNAQMLTLAGPDSDFYNSLRAAMLPYVLLDPATGEPVFSSTYNTVYFDYRKLAGAAIYAQWIAANCPFDIYLDDFTPEFPRWKESDLPPALVPALRAAFMLWREGILAALREVRPDGPIIANVGAGLTDPRLNGITIEQSHIDRSHVMALARFATQWTRGRQPCYSVDWSGRWDGPVLGIHAGELDE